jgi:hypothetical protein
MNRQWGCAEKILDLNEEAKEAVKSAFGKNQPACAGKYHNCGLPAIVFLGVPQG